MFHYCNWRLWGDERDKLAWKGLTGEVGREEIIHELRMLGFRNGYEAMQERRAYLMKNDPEFAHRVRENFRRIQPKAVAASLSDESRRKRLESFSRIEHQKGERNSQYGTIWITDGEVNKKISREEEIPEGFRRGRTLQPKKNSPEPENLDDLEEGM